jgi:esterase/lipase superfamily enzyme
MNVELLIKALYGAETDLQVEDILDALWLATRGRTLTLHAVSAPPPPTPLPPPADEVAPDVVPPIAPPGGGGSRGVEETPPEADASTPVYAAGEASAGEDNVKASPVSLPAGHALTGRLLLSRALRPFLQRWPSRHQQVLDEERTAEATAELRGQLYPVFSPLQERWFDVNVVLEDDPVIGLWRDTLRDFSQILRDTGAFRDVGSWRLRMSDERTAPGQARKTPVLESPTRRYTRTTALAGAGTRRLVFFATHGFSGRWLDGSYARLIAPWLRGASVVILHLFDREDWKRGALGEPHGLCRAQDPGAVTSTLRVDRYWWTLADDEQEAIYVPAIPLAPGAIGEWSHMQMARGRQCPVFLLDRSLEPAAEPEPPSGHDFERGVGLLREISPDAFRLAVYLSAGAFTIPVARLVQEAKFGAAARQQHLAEILLSGLVFPRSPREEGADPNELYYEFHPEARAVLMRSLRSEDAAEIAGEIERRVSQYIEEISGRAVTFRALVADAEGKYDLPQWAQPFARLGVSLLGTLRPGRTVAQLLEAFRAEHPPAIVARVAWLAAATPGKALNPEDVDQSLWDKMVHSGLVRRSANGRWRFVPELEALLEPIAATDRQRSLGARKFRMMEALRSIGIDGEAGLQWSSKPPRELGEHILAEARDTEAAFQSHLRVIQAYAGSTVNQLLLVRNNRLHVIASVIDPRMSGSLYEYADWGGVIGRAAQLGEVVWAHDVSLDPSYLRAEPSTRSELALPLVRQAGHPPVGVVNVEMEEPDALSEADVRWLAEFCIPLTPRLQDWRSGEAAEEPMQQAVAENAPRVESRGVPDARLGRHDLALVVGIGNYLVPGMPAIKDAEADARLFYDWLLAPDGGGVPPSGAMLLFSRTATQKELQHAFEVMAGRSATGRRLYLYFCGHALSVAGDLLLLAADSTPLEPSRLGPLSVRAFVEYIRKAGNPSELVIIVDAPPLQPAGQYIIGPPIALVEPSPRFPLFSLFLARGAAPKARGFTKAIVEGLRGAAASGEAEEITGGSLGDYLQRHGGVHFEALGSIVFRPALAIVWVFARMVPPTGVVRVTDSFGVTVAEGRLNEASCSFRLGPGRYRAEHTASGIAEPFEVLSGMARLKVMLRSQASGDRAAEPSSAKQYSLIDVFFATTRSRSALTAAGISFGGERGDRAYGVSNVSIPRSHRFGEVEQPRLLRFEITENPGKHITVTSTRMLQENDYFEAIVNRLRQRNHEDILLLVHGYNVGFDAALRTAAQVASDLRFKGIPLMFSWPSRATLSGYAADQANAEWSAPFLGRLLLSLSRIERRRLHLISHSMGARVVVGAMADIGRAEGSDGKKVLQNVVLISPDIDSAHYLQLAPQLVSFAERVSLYAWKKDRALHASQVIHETARVGGSGMLLANGVDTIEVVGPAASTAVKLAPLDVLADLAGVIDGLAPERRSGLRAVESDAGLYWQLKLRH